jgi:hypothetical protein
MAEEKRAREPKKNNQFRRFYKRDWQPMYEKAEEFMSKCKLEQFSRDKVLNVMTAFAIEELRRQEF